MPFIWAGAGPTNAALAPTARQSVEDLIDLLRHSIQQQFANSTIQRVVFDVTRIQSHQFFSILHSCLETSQPIALRLINGPEVAGRWFTESRTFTESHKSAHENINALNRPRASGRLERVFHARISDRLLPWKMVVLPTLDRQRMQQISLFAEQAFGTRGAEAEWLIDDVSQLEDAPEDNGLSRLFGDSHTKHAICGFDYRGVLKVLDELWGRHHLSHSLAIVDCGKQLYWLAVFIFSAMHPDIPILFAEPLQSELTLCSDNTWTIDFENFAELHKAVKEWNKLEFVWSNHTDADEV